jgi:hypothetical protein
MIDEVSRELATVAESHEPEIIDAPEPNLTEDELSRPPSSDSGPYPQTSKTERGSLRVDTHVGHVHHPPSTIVGSSGRLSPALTSESDRDDRRRSAIRPAISFPSFHLPTRRNSKRERSVETSLLSSTSRSSLTSNSSASGLCTPPHSPPTASFLHADIISPSSHLSAISELQNIEDIEDHFDHLFPLAIEEKSTHTLTRAERSGSSSRVHGEIDEQEEPGQAATTTAAWAIPVAADALVHRPTDSPTDTVTVPISSLPSRNPQTQVPTQLSAVLSPASSLPSPEPSLEPSPEPSPVSPMGRSWPFVGRSVSVSLNASKAEKAEQKKRKKEMARTRKEQLALELKKRSEVLDADGASMQSNRVSSKRISNSRAWEEDIAMYGGLASM